MIFLTFRFSGGSPRSPRHPWETPIELPESFVKKIEKEIF